VAPQPTPQFVLDCWVRRARTEDATNLVDTGGARVVALGDLFQDQLDKARDTFNKMQQAKGYSALDESQLFVGPTAFQKMAASKEVDAIVIATPPYFHPQHLEAAVAAANTLPGKAGGPWMCGSFEGNRTRETRSREAEPGRGVPDPRLPAFCELVRRIHGGLWAKSFAAKRTTFRPRLMSPESTRSYTSSEAFAHRRSVASCGRSM